MRRRNPCIRAETSVPASMVAETPISFKIRRSAACTIHAKGKPQIRKSRSVHGFIEPETGRRRAIQHYPGFSGENALGHDFQPRFGTTLVSAGNAQTNMFAQAPRQSRLAMRWAAARQQMRRGSNRMIFRHPARFPSSSQSGNLRGFLPAPRLGYQKRELG